jgi:hypothetical protein
MTLSTPRNRRFAHSGQRYLQLTNRLANSTVGVGLAADIRPGDYDSTTVWLRAARSGTLVTVSVNVSGGSPTESRSVTVAVPRGWIPVTVGLPVSGSGHSGLGISVTSVTRSRTVYVDDVSASTTR